MAKATDQVPVQHGYANRWRTCACRCCCCTGCAAVLLLLVALIASYWYTHRPQPPITRDRTLFPGITYTRIVMQVPAPRVCHIVTVALNAPGIGLLVTPGDPSKPRPLRARTTSEFLRDFHCQVAINGDFFFPWHSTNLLDYYPHVGDPVELEGVATSRGVPYSSGGQRWRFPKLCVSRDNRCTFVSTPLYAYNTISGDMLVVDHGNVKSGQDEYHLTRQPRSAVALSRDGRSLILVVVDGRQPGYSEGATTEELGQIILQAGGWTGLNLDGGGSSTLVAEGPDGRPVVLNCPIDCRVPGRERAVANHLGVFARVRPRAAP